MTHTNHLGNVLALIGDRKQKSQQSTQHQAPEVVNLTDYYPFGMVMPGRSCSNEGYRYGFQGQEEDDELWSGAVSYKYRVEDPRLGRFFSVDPLACHYAFYSPYAFSGNRVIDMIELEGLEPTSPEYLWEITYQKRYSHGTLLKVDGWFVFISVNEELEEIHQYFDPNEEEWKDFNPVQPHSVSSDMAFLAGEFLETSAEIAGPTLTIFGGLVAIAAAIPSGGSSMAVFSTALAVTSGTYAVAAGVTELTLNLADQQELAEKIPSGYLTATIGITITTLVEGEEHKEVINAVLTVAEGIATLSIRDPSVIQKLDNAINAGKIVYEVYDVTTSEEDGSDH